MRAKLSVVMITLNEERNLARALESIKWADEIVIVDAFSQDRTKEIAKKYTGNIYDLAWTGYGPAKQFALEKASFEWVLSLDSDEVLSEPLQLEIQSVLQTEVEFDGYSVCRMSNFLGQWMKHGGWYPDYVLRLFRKDKAHFTAAAVHEELIVTGKSGHLNGLLLHYTDPNLEHYLTKLNRYTTLSAQELLKKGETANLTDLLFRPPALFIKMYLLKFGFLDGVQGFLLALYSSFHVLTKYAKLWLLQRRP
jgi:glycosyltransferase involved in cell wall biosynthesis